MALSSGRIFRLFTDSPSSICLRSFDVRLRFLKSFGYAHTQVFLTGDVSLFENLLIPLVDLLGVVDGVRVDLLADALHGSLGCVRDVRLAFSLK